MNRVFISERAGDDLYDIWHYVASDSVEAANRLVTEIEARFQVLADFPELGPARDDVAAGFRYFPIGNYLILYRVEPDGVGIVRVLHAARHVEDLT